MLVKKFFKLMRNIFCAIGLILISPILLFAALIIIIEDGMPVFFIQDRVGKNNKIFKIIKLRTLKKEAPDTGTHQLDPKYQLICGKIFRKIKLDEFPQLINVVKGDINLIGPRPGLQSQVELTKLRSAKGVYEIKPGITGLSQVLGYDMSDPLKLAEIDKLYIKNKSFYIDFLILIRTFIKFPKNYLFKLIT
tara:strand:- start:1180 stop:1755 length:576 start_codon:yes stop_codon:yes gene_type:complete